MKKINPADLPAFLYHLGDVVYSFGEATYYYDQFYDAYRDYPAPIMAIAGNHDGMVAPGSSAGSLDAFRNNFCASGQPLHTTPEAGGLVCAPPRFSPASISLSEAPFVRVFWASTATLWKIPESSRARAARTRI